MSFSHILSNLGASFSLIDLLIVNTWHYNTVCVFGSVDVDTCIIICMKNICKCERRKMVSKKHTLMISVVQFSDESMDEETQNEEEEFIRAEFKSAEQISDELITLSLLPNSRWQNLLNLNIIKVVFEQKFYLFSSTVATPCLFSVSVLSFLCSQLCHLKSSPKWLSSI